MSFPEGLKKRKHSWNVKNNLLFIDQPVGTGFSYTNKQCYPTNETMVGEELYQAVKQFHLLFPNFQENKFFISGESYAGHYIPALGHTIHKYKSSTSVIINLSAMLIGNGWMDPVLQIDYASYLYQVGLIDDTGKEKYKEKQDLFIQQVGNEDWTNAFLTDDLFTNQLFKEYVGQFVDYYDYRSDVHKTDQNWQEFVQSAKIRKAIHVGNIKYQTNVSIVVQALANDSVQTVKPWVEELLEEYPIIFYNGQNDIICAYPLMINFIQALSWSGQYEYLNASRTKWCVGKAMAGYYKGVNNLHEVLIRDAGHMVPSDQPLWAYILINSVTSGTKNDPLHRLKECISSTTPAL